MADNFVDDLIDAMPTPHARIVLFARLANYAGQSVYIPIGSKRSRRIQEARNMANNGMTNSEIAKKLTARYRISKRTAIRDVNSARQMSLSDVSQNE